MLAGGQLANMSAAPGAPLLHTVKLSPTCSLHAGTEYSRGARKLLGCRSCSTPAAAPGCAHLQDALPPGSTLAFKHAHARLEGASLQAADGAVDALHALRQVGRGLAHLDRVAPELLGHKAPPGRLVLQRSTCC